MATNHGVKQEKTHLNEFMSLLSTRFSNRLWYAMFSSCCLLFFPSPFAVDVTTSTSFHKIGNRLRTAWLQCNPYFLHLCSFVQFGRIFLVYNKLSLLLRFFSFLSLPIKFSRFFLRSLTQLNGSKVVVSYKTLRCTSSYHLFIRSSTLNESYKADIFQ